MANMAANTLDERRISSLDDTTSFAKFCAAEFGYLRDEFIRAYPWTFAKDFRTVAKDTTDPPMRWKYQYTIPTEYLRLMPLTYRMEHNGRPILYEKVGNKIWTDCEAPLYIGGWVKKVNMPDWDVLAARAFGQYIAVHAAQRVVGKISYLQKAEQALERSLFNARHVDSLEMGTVEDFIESEIVDVRSFDTNYADTLLN